MRFCHGSLAAIGVSVLTSVVSPGTALAIDPAVQPQVVLMEGDLVAGVGAIQFLSSLTVNNSGDTFVLVDTDHMDIHTDEAIVRNGPLPYLREGQLLAATPGLGIGAFGLFHVNNNGKLAWSCDLENAPGSNSSAALFLDSQLIVQQGDHAAWTGAPANSPFTEFLTTRVNDSDRLLSVGTIDDPLVAGTEAFIMTVDSVTGLQSRIAYQGDPAPGTAEMFLSFGDLETLTDMNSAGDVIYVANLTGPTTADSAIYINGAPLVREGDPALSSTHTWESLSASPVGINDFSDHVFHGDTTASALFDEVLVMNGEIVKQELDSHPDISPYAIESFGSARVDISNHGDVLWYARWSDPMSTRDEGVFVNQKLLIQEGVTQVGDMTVTAVHGLEGTQQMSDDGRYYILAVELTHNVTMIAKEGVILVDRGPFEILGGTEAGGPGEPILRGWGPLTGGSEVTFDLENATPFGLASMIIGKNRIDSPLLCTTLIPAPDIIVYNLPADVNGALSFTVPLPPIVPASQVFYMQYFIQDAGACLGYSATNAIKGTLQ